MSMWEIEALAEMGIDLWHAHAPPHVRKADAFASVYRLMAPFDCKFIHFHSTDKLTSAGFLHVMELADHPEYAARRAELDAIATKGDEAWLSHGDTLEAIYTSAGHGPPRLWFDSSMALWAKAKAAGRLIGDTARPVAVWAPNVTMVETIRLASTTGRDGPALMKGMHGLVASTIVAGTDVPKTPDPLLQRALDTPGLAEALHGPTLDFIDERFDARSQLSWASEETKPFLDWWCGPYAGGPPAPSWD